MANGLLLAALRIGRAADDEFHDWYDTEHLPERARVPGVLQASRWIDVSDSRLAVASYDLTDVDVLRGAAWQAINGENLSPWSKRMIARVEWVMRAEAEQILPGKEAPPAEAGGLLINAMNVAPEREAEFNAWYDTEHIPALAAVPGVLSARRFRATAGGPKYLALYHLTGPEVVESKAWDIARTSDWTTRVTPSFRDRIRLVLRRYVRAR
jgi:hypothetical protein